LTDAYVPRHVLVFVVFLEEKAKYSSCAACSVRLKVQIDFWWRQQGFSQQEEGVQALIFVGTHNRGLRRSLFSICVLLVGSPCIRSTADGPCRQ